MKLLKIVGLVIAGFGLFYLPALLMQFLIGDNVRFVDVDIEDPELGTVTVFVRV